MKWLFLLLLCLNFAIFIWGSNQFVPAPVKGDFTKDDGIASIEVLSNNDLEVLRLSASKKQKDESENQGSKGSQLETTPAEIIQEPEENLLSETAIEALDDTSVQFSGSEAVSIITGQTSSQVTSDASQQQPESKAEIAEPTQEDELLSSIRPEENEAPVAIEEEHPEHSTTCWSIGPVDETDTAKRLHMALLERGITANLREEGSRKITGYWVLLPPYVNVKSARNAVAELKSQGLVDVQRFYKGEFRNGVSLGVYNRRFNAEKRKAQVEEKGFSPKVIPRYRKILHYWLDYHVNSQPAGIEFSRDDLKQYSRQQLPCPE